MPDTFDTRMMARALQLARRGMYAAMPNPHVGCVLVRGDQVIGEGFTQPAGGNHAEIQALKAAGDATGATAYVTLEPCSHTGKTGPFNLPVLFPRIGSCSKVEVQGFAPLLFKVIAAPFMVVCAIYINSPSNFPMRSYRPAGAMPYLVHDRYQDMIGK